MALVLEETSYTVKVDPYMALVTSGVASLPCQGSIFPKIYFFIYFFLLPLATLLLPPCLGHDLFEGVVNYDVAFYSTADDKRKQVIYQELKKSNNKISSKPCTVTINQNL